MDDKKGGSGIENYDSISSSCSSDDNDAMVRPTHIYINGYQSWSYAGSVPRGENQPRSAMPDLFSGAFNAGGTVPPKPSEGHDIQTAAEEGGGRGYESWSEDGRQASHVVNNGDAEGIEMIPSRRRRQGREQGGPLRGSDSGLDAEMDELGNNPLHYRSDFYCVITSRSGDDDSIGAGGESSGRGGVPLSPPALDEDGGPSLVLGWLSQRRQFGIITSDSSLRRFQMHASAGSSPTVPFASFGRGGHGGGTDDVPDAGMSTDWAYAQVVPPHCYDEEPASRYLTAVAMHNNARPMRFPNLLTGWCSWYHYYENIDAETLKGNCRTLSGIKTNVGANLALIDDGYMTAWGDWSSLKKKQFPGDPDQVMRGIADEIRSNGMKPGLWLAPYACDKNSKLAKEHPDWIIHNDEGRIANSSNCGNWKNKGWKNAPPFKELKYICV